MFLLLSLIVIPVNSHAAVLTVEQQIAILQEKLLILQGQINTLQTQQFVSSSEIATDSSGNVVTPVRGEWCNDFTYDMAFGSQDAYTGGQVSRLQKFLSNYGVVTGWSTNQTSTGYFGLITENAVKKFQAYYGIVSSGTGSATGYGVVGPQTRIKMSMLPCGPGVLPPSTNQQAPSPMIGSSNNTGDNDGKTLTATVPDAPTITGITPIFDSVGSAITILGTGYTPTGNTVYMGNGTWSKRITNLNSTNGTSLTLVIPSDAPLGNHIITVINSSGVSIGRLFMVTNKDAEKPIVTSTSPVFANAGQSVILTGRNFTLYNNTIILRGLSVANANLWNKQITGLTSVTGTQLTFTIPLDAPAGDHYIDVSNQYGTSVTGYRFMVTNPVSH